MRDRPDPYCRCEDRVSMAGIVTYCPGCRARAFRVGCWVIVCCVAVGVAIGVLLCR